MISARTICFVLLVAAATGVLPAVHDPGAAEAATRPAPGLGTGVVLFVDNHRIEATSGLRRTYPPATKVRVGTRPLGQVDIRAVRTYHGADDSADGDVDIDSLYLHDVSTVMEEEVDGKPLYRMWFRSGYNTGYRESDDGLTWRVRDPDSVIVAKDVVSASVVRDTRSGLYYLTGWNPRKPGYVEMVSTDGVSFTHTTRFRGLLSNLRGDVIKSAFDPVTGQMTTMAKESSADGKACWTRSRVLRSGGRAFGPHVSAQDGVAAAPESGRTWMRRSAPVLTSDCVDQASVPAVPGTSRPGHVYGVSYQRYGDQLLGMLWFFQVTAAAPSPELSGHADGPIDTQITSTPNLETTPWFREDPIKPVAGRWTRPSVIQRGPSGSWDGGMLFGQANIMTMGNRSRVYYTGWNTMHAPVRNQAARIGAAEWWRDRFVGMWNPKPGRWAVLRSRGFRLSDHAAGRDLHVNANVPQERTMQVAVLDARTRRPIAGYGYQDSTIVRGDRLDATVTWRGKSLGQLRNRDISLSFRFTEGQLYAFAVR